MCTWEEFNTGLPEVNENLYLGAIAMDPTDPAVLYIGSSFYGAYKSTDGGRVLVSDQYGPALRPGRGDYHRPARIPHTS